MSCASCRTVFYCSASCQAKDWARHRRPCRKMVAKMRAHTEALTRSDGVDPDVAAMALSAVGVGMSLRVGEGDELVDAETSMCAVAGSDADEEEEGVSVTDSDGVSAAR
jgi:hypothetical protein